MPEQSKFENVDLFASLEAIMKQNTGFYQSDLDIDKEIIAKAAASPNREDKTLLWFCRPSGTHCFRERDVFLKDTAPHKLCKFRFGQSVHFGKGALCKLPHIRVHVGQRGVDILNQSPLAALVVNAQKVCFLNSQSNHAHTSIS